jgi:hypothetical protein
VPTQKREKKFQLPSAAKLGTIACLGGSEASGERAASGS